MMTTADPKICPLSKMIDTVKRCSNAGERFCFILGAGASVTSGIDSGAKMAKELLEELKRHDPKRAKQWLAENKIDENNLNKLGNYFSKLYEMCFDTHPSEGYIWLQKKMETAYPGLGYYHLANILAKNLYINLVITTNFDSLTEDAIFLYTNKKPLVVTHELLAKYVNFFTGRPIIAKIHRDFTTSLKVAEGETCKLAEDWEPVLREALSRCSPIVIGYGGNDGSLMGLLSSVFKETKSKEKKSLPIYWCYRKDSKLREDVIKFLNECGGVLVPIYDFDETMLSFGVAFGDVFNERDLMSQMRSRIKVYIQMRNEITERLKKQSEQAVLFGYEKTVFDAIAVSRKNESSEVAREKVAPIKDSNSISVVQRDELNELTAEIDKNPEDAWLYNRRGDYYYNIKRYLESVADYAKAISIDSTDAVYYYNRGMAYTWLSEHEAAVIDFGEAIKLDSTNADYYHNRGIAHYWLAEYEAAVIDFGEAIKLDSTNADYYYVRGITYNWLAEDEKAVIDFGEAIKLDSNNAQYYATYAVALYEVDKTAEAFISLEKAHSLDANLPDYYGNYGYINLKIAKKTKSLCPSEVLNNIDKAIELANKQDLPNSLSTFYTDRAEYHLYIGEIDKAYDDLQKSLQIHDYNGRTWYYLSKYYDAKNNAIEYNRCINKSKALKYIPKLDD